MRGISSCTIYPNLTHIEQVEGPSTCDVDHIHGPGISPVGIVEWHILAILDLTLEGSRRGSWVGEDFRIVRVGVGHDDRRTKEDDEKDSTRFSCSGGNGGKHFSGSVDVGARRPTCRSVASFCRRMVDGRKAPRR